MSYPTITLISDMGIRDASVAGAKAILMRKLPDAVFVDVSHYTAQYDLQQAAYILLCAYDHFVKGTVHLIAVDIFGNDTPRMLLAEKDGYFFIAPDNGILPLAFGNEPMDIKLCFEFSRPYNFHQWLECAAEVIRAIQIGNYSSLFSNCEAKNIPRSLQPQVMPHSVDCNILYIDRYENVVLDITRPQFDEIVNSRPFKIKIMRMDDVTAISSNYSDVDMGKALCRFNSAGFMEIAINHGFAASLLGLGAHNMGSLRYQTVKIFFG